MRTVDAALTVSLAAYTADDVVGGLIALDMHSPQGGGVLKRLILVDEDSQAEAYTAYIFDRAPSAIDDADTFEPTLADLQRLIAIVPIAAMDYETLNDGTADHDIVMVDLDIEFTAGDGRLYVYLVATDTPDYANADALLLRATARLD
jgi:hypothetical protein